MCLAEQREETGQKREIEKRGERKGMLDVKTRNRNGIREIKKEKQKN